MVRMIDRPFDWIAALATASGAAVILPSMIALLIAVFSVCLVVFENLTSAL